jgi:hypothetical protein
MRFSGCGFTREISGVIQIKNTRSAKTNLSFQVFTFHITVPQSLSTLKNANPQEIARPGLKKLRNRERWISNKKFIPVLDKTPAGLQTKPLNTGPSSGFPQFVP